MKLCQFLKRWRQAYLDDKGDRLHAQAEVECNRCESFDKNDAFSCSTFDKRLLRAISDTAEDAYLKRGFFSE